MVLSESKPPWLRIKLPGTLNSSATIKEIKSRSLHTVCVEARCPNQMECFRHGTATFLLLGPHCTRNCTFCAVGKKSVMPPDLSEPYKVAEAVLKMNLKYCVLTMTTRDDLSDGGAYHIVQTIETMRKMVKNLNLELLVSDLNGNWSALENILAAHPEVLNHNIETVPRLYSGVRPKADYQRSLKLLSKASKHLPPLITKSGIMLGLGESKAEILQTMQDLRKVGCQILTLGQYLAPSPQHHPVIRYLPPEEFAQLKMEAIKFGFSATASSPLVRSSFQAEALFHAANSQGRSAPT